MQPLEKVKVTKSYRENHYLIYDNHKVIIFHLLDYTSPVIPKLYGKNETKVSPIMK